MSNARELVPFVKNDDGELMSYEEYGQHVTDQALNVLSQNYKFPKQYVNRLADAAAQHIHNQDLKAKHQRLYMHNALDISKKLAYHHAKLAIQQLEPLSYFRDNPDAIMLANEEAWTNANSAVDPDAELVGIPPTLQHAIDNSLPEYLIIRHDDGGETLYDSGVEYARARVAAVDDRVRDLRKHLRVYNDEGAEAYYRFLQNPQALYSDQVQWPQSELATDPEQARLSAVEVGKYRLPRARVRKAGMTWQMRTNLPRLKREIEQDATLRNISTRRAWLRWVYQNEDLDTLPMLRYITGKGTVNDAIKSVGLGWRPKGWSRPKGWGLSGVARPDLGLGARKKSIFGPR